MANLHAGVGVSNQYPVSEDNYVEMMKLLEKSFKLRPLEIIKTIIE